jgi:hypothetical protein
MDSILTAAPPYSVAIPYEAVSYEAAAARLAHKASRLVDSQRGWFILLRKATPDGTFDVNQARTEVVL